MTIPAPLRENPCTLIETRCDVAWRAVDIEEIEDWMMTAQCLNFIGLDYDWLCGTCIDLMEVSNDRLYRRIAALESLKEYAIELGNQSLMSLSDESLQKCMQVHNIRLKLITVGEVWTDGT